MYKYLLFDADNTLLDFYAAEEAALKDTLTECPLGFSTEVHKRYSEINKEEWEKLERGETTRNILVVNRYVRLFDEFGLDGRILGEGAARNYEKHLATYAPLMPDAEKVLSVLSLKYDIYIITNGLATVQKSRMAKSGLLKYIKKSYISEEMNSAKPEKKFFDLVVSDIGDGDKRNYLVIGDSLTSDIAGANNAGMDSVLVAEPGKSCGVATYTVYGLSELLNLL